MRVVIEQENIRLICHSTTLLQRNKMLASMVILVSMMLYENVIVEQQIVRHYDSMNLLQSNNLYDALWSCLIATKLLTMTLKLFSSKKTSDLNIEEISFLFSTDLISFFEAGPWLFITRSTNLNIVVISTQISVFRWTWPRCFSV